MGGASQGRSGWASHTQRQLSHRAQNLIARPPNGHWSLLSFRRPQCISLRSVNVRSILRFKARSTPMRACISGPRSSAAINSASIAACHSSDCRVLPGDAMTWLAASLSVRQCPAAGSVIGSSKRRDQSTMTQPRRAITFDRSILFGRLRSFAYRTYRIPERKAPRFSCSVVVG
jgi:hypothetical protein